MSDSKISALPTKVTPIGADATNILDSAAANADRKITLSSLPISTATQTALNTKMTGNAAIVAATKTKITYDTKGLVTSGADATTADIADSTNKRYVTDAQLTVISNTSGTNTGDQDLSTKEAVANKAVNLTTPDNTKYPSTLAVSTALALKQNNLGFTPENVVNKATNLITPNNTKYPTTLAVSTALGLKQNLIGYTPEDQANKVTDILSNLNNTRYPSTRAVYDFVTINAPYYHIKNIRFEGCGPGLSGETPILFYAETKFLEKNGSLVVHSIVCRREPGIDKIFFRLRISNSDDYATSTIIATCQISSSDRISIMQRTFTNDGSNLYGVEFAYSLNTDMIQHPIYDQIPFDWDQNYFFWVTVEIVDASDSCEIGGIKIGV